MQQGCGKEKSSLLSRTPESTSRYEQIDHDWLFAKIDNDDVIFDAVEVNETVDNILSLLPGRSAGKRVVINEVEDDASSVESIGFEANEHMRAADAGMHQEEMMSDFGGVLASLLADPGVQQACVKALRRDPAFEQLLDRHTPQLEYPCEVNMNSFLPPAAKVADRLGEQEDVRNPIEVLLQTLSNVFGAVGHELEQAGKAMGKFLVGLGYSLHQLLGRPFTGQAPSTAPARDNMARDIWHKRLIKAACVVMAVLIFKRVHKVNFVWTSA
ncbi:hypothetical protein WJX72_007617 [[Myrmecia] bisecta]|uniref:Uncharacterized protein n=1 Tax=[Myrmecia] bisecta TaxID=41462 RepID=A0AAW1PDX6_9CHLO